MIILYIAEANINSKSPGSNRCTKFIEYFSSKVSEIRHIDPVKHQASETHPAFKSGKGNKYHKIKLRVKKKLHSRMINSSIFSAHFTSCIFKLLIWKFRGFRPDLIFISYKPPSVLFLGSFAKLLFRSKLIVEYRDLASTFSDSDRSLVIKKIDFLTEWLFLKLVNKVIVVSPSQATRFSLSFKRNAHVVLNGIDPFTSDISQARAAQTITEKRNPLIVYAGTLSHRRNLNPFGKVIRNLGLNLKVFSKQDPLAFTDDQTLSDAISFEGYKKRTHLIQAYSEADGFLLLEGYNQSSHENIPSKVFEYIYFRKPIYFCGNVNSDVGQILIDLGLLIHISEAGELTDYLDEKKLKTNFRKYFRTHQFENLERLILNGD